MKVDLHLVSWNRPKMTELVIKTIHRNTNRDNFRLVVLDNGSDGDTPERLQDLADNGLIDEYLPIKTNLGLEYARNLLLNNCTQSDYFICVDNDCLPPPPHPSTPEMDWVEELVDLIQAYPGYAAISARTDPMIGTGNIFEEADKNGDDLVDFTHPGGSLRIMNTILVTQVGGWSRKDVVSGRGAEERLICGKLRDFGYKTAFATNVRTLHLYGPPETTDRWGYPKDWKPEDTGHSDIWHPKFAQGDDPKEIEKYSGKELAKWFQS
jgi:glycosyltransferase involved in cell wall biosynthesis